MADMSADEKAGTTGSVTTSSGAGAVDDIHAEWTPAEERAIRIKFDLTITPLVTLLCMSFVSLCLLLYPLLFSSLTDQTCAVRLTAPMLGKALRCSSSKSPTALGL